MKKRRAEDDQSEGRRGTAPGPPNTPSGVRGGGGGTSVGLLLLVAVAVGAFLVGVAVGARFATFAGQVFPLAATEAARDRTESPGPDAHASQSPCLRHRLWPAKVTLDDTGTDDFTAARLAQVKEYRFPRFETRRNVFTKKQLNKLMELVARDSEKGGLQWVEGTLGSLTIADGRPNASVRSADVAPIPKTADFAWLYKKIVALVNEVNDGAWQYLIPSDYRSPLVEYLQVSRYSADRSGHCTWHRDTGFHNATAKRRVSITIQLSDPEEYSGGDLEVMEPTGTITMERTRNTATVFASILSHRVSPVTRGVRYSLVSWYQTV